MSWGNGSSHENPFPLDCIFCKIAHINNTIFFDKNHAKKVTKFDNFFHENSTRKSEVKGEFEGIPSSPKTYVNKSEGSMLILIEIRK